APRMAGFQPLEPSGIRTATIIRVRHPEVIPQEIFEFQHYAGNDLQHSLTKGFESWAQVDLVVLLEALRDKLQVCTAMEMTFPETDARPARERRVILGPIAHMAARAELAPSDHPFCPCCLLTNTFEAFRAQLEGEDFFAIRLFALRDENGQTS